MNKINVLQVSNQLGIGGTEKALETFATYLNKDFFNVYICGIFESGPREQILRGKGLETTVTYGNKESFFNLLKEKKIDILHIHRSGKNEGFVIQTAKKAGVPVVVETNVFGLNDTGETEKMIDMHLLVSKTTSLKYIQNSRISIDDFLHKCRVMYNPVNLENFEKYKPSEEQISRFKYELGICSEAPIICRVGRPDIWKWSMFSVDMMSYLIKKIPSVKFLIVGGIPQEVQSRIRRLHIDKNFIDMGVISEERLILVYYTMDILTHCSRIGESFGYTIAETMAAGKPVVVNSTPWADNAQIELVDNGKTGFVANIPRTYAEAVAYLINNKEARKMGMSGQKKACRDYDAKKITLMLEKIYLDLLVRKGIISKNALKNYELVDLVPTNADILHYPIEYSDRLLACFGKSNLREKLELILKWRHFS